MTVEFENNIVKHDVNFRQNQIDGLDQRGSMSSSEIRSPQFMEEEILLLDDPVCILVSISSWLTT